MMQSGSMFVSLVLGGILLTACSHPNPGGTAQVNQDTGPNKGTVKPILSDTSPVRVDPLSPNQQYAQAIAHMLNRKYGERYLSRAVLEDVQLYPKQNNPDFLVGEANLFVELLGTDPTLSQNYKIGSNKEYFILSKDNTAVVGLNSAPFTNTQTSSGTQTPDPVPAKNLPQGIITDFYPISMNYEFENLWQKTYPDMFVQVYAGNITKDPKQGVAVVYQYSLDLSQFKSIAVATPTKHGSIKVVSESGNVLTMKVEDGTLFTFDVKEMKFESR